MNDEIYRYEFESTVPLAEVEGSMVLALLAAESLHGETEVQISASHYLDMERRTCIVDAGNRVGRDLNRLFAGFVRREFGGDAFRVSSVPRHVDAESRTAA